MSGQVCKTVEIPGFSPAGIDESSRRAVEKASGTVRSVDWFEVSTQGHRADGAIDHFQVNSRDRLPARLTKRSN